ncbi:MAG: restriction endonuclease subunit S [Deltaproteobacteria bacterium]|nr:restriction endonuclease subunit S [Deltaproteobacteria bacterium]
MSPKHPQHWRWCRIGEAGEVRLGRQRTPAHHNGPHMVQYLRVANVMENRIDLSDVKMMNFTPDEQAVFLLKPGDILLNEGQSPHLVGRPAMYRGELTPCFFQNTLVRFRANEGVLPGWALLVFRAQMHAMRYKQFAKITTNIAHLGAERFAQVEFPLPPVTEQRALLEAFEAHESVLDAAEQGLKRVQAKLKHARASVLKAAVEGRLVPTEAALARAEGRRYEPASALLARVLAERRARWAERGERGKYKEPVAPETEGLPELPEGWVWALWTVGRTPCEWALRRQPEPERHYQMRRAAWSRAGHPGRPAI